MRSCIACRRNASKQQLVRITRGTDGILSCDPSGRKPGRGAYVCANPACFDLIERKRRLGNALKCEVTLADYQRLRAEFNAVCEVLPHANGTALSADALSADVKD
ncbi:MAG: YlxR family protein [Coriobacteriales bacterium]|nr:YlxR family protein [Coriobacteriales bacterium]